MRFAVEDASPEDVLHVLRHMRPEDRREAFAIMPFGADLWALFHHYQSLAPYQAAFWRLAIGDDPMGIMGVWRMRDGVGEAHLLATPEFNAHAREVAAAIRSSMAEFMRGQSLRRISCACLSEHRRSRAFLKLAGAREEAILVAFGREGEEFRQFVWVA